MAGQAGQVSGDLNQITGVGREYVDVAGQARGIVTTIEGIVMEMKGPAWSGAAADAAETVINGILARATQLSTILDGHGSATMQGSTAMGAQEDVATGRLRALANSTGGGAGIVPSGGGGALASTINT